MDESSGLTAPRLSALSVIVFKGPITLGKLAGAEQVRPPTMTRIVNALEEQELVVKAKDPSDGRVIRIAATTKGKRVLVRGRARRIQLVAEQIGRLGKAERENLSAALGTIQGVVDRINQLDAGVSGGEHDESSIRPKRSQDGAPGG
ncbi:MAG: MarR family transcriptional regulator [Acidobacteriaceae bacterium]